MTGVYLSIGSNLGDRYVNLQQATQKIAVGIGDLVNHSRIYETQAWGYEGQNFLNRVLLVQTAWPPLELLKKLKEIENEMGRIKTSDGYEDRCIDLDILFYDALVLEKENLIIPHPAISDRLFVLVPLCDLAPDFIHPVLQKTNKMLLDACTDQGWIHPYPCPD